MMENFQIAAGQFPWIFGVFFFALGACAGSFMNVCIYRIPAEKSVVRPRSQCRCGKPIAWYDNIPIASWFILRGRARCCGERFSFRYAAVEIMTACAYLYLWSFFPAAEALAWMMFVSLIIVVSFIDIDTMELPDMLTIGGMVAGVAVSMLVPEIHFDANPAEPRVFSALKAFIVSVSGVAVGSGILYWLRLLAECFLKREAMGEGDVVLIGCIGAFCGWQGAVFSIFGGSFIGALVMVPAMLISKLLFRGRGLRAEIPFGPWLGMGAVAYALFLRDFVDSYFAGLAGVFFGGL